jgi:hypothetical protein
MIRSGLTGIGEILEQLDRNFGEDHWGRIHAMEDTIKLGWKQLPAEFRPQLVSLSETLRQKSGLHLAWNSILNEVEVAITDLENSAAYTNASTL